MKFVVMIRMVMNGLSILQKRRNVGDKIGLDFEPEAIHVMRLGETEEEFDKRLESYGDDQQ